MLIEVAREIPLVSPDSDPTVASAGGAKYRVSIPLQSPGDEGAVLDAFTTRLWYAARRADLHLDGDLTDDWNSEERLLAALRQVSPALSLHPADAEELATSARLERYAQGEVILRPGTVPRATRFILSGRVMLGVPTDSGFVQITELSRDDAIGLTALTRSRTISKAIALTEVEVLNIPVAVLDDIVRAHPSLAREVVRENDNRIRLARSALEAVGERLDPTRRVMG
jgi:CRP-like cAMP-binding protein